MSRVITAAVAQMGPVARSDTRTQVVERLVAMMRDASACGCSLVVFPELALTTFFPRWFMADQTEVDQFFETEMPGPQTQPLFDEARRLKIGFYLGYAELCQDEAGSTRHFNTSILVNEQGEIVGKYRKIHLPGHPEHEPWRPFQHLEKRYFERGNLGFGSWDAFGGKIGMALCNDRRWPETYRVMALQGAEMILLGYNTPMHYPPVPEHDHLQGFHNHLCMQASAYQNGCWILAAAKAGKEEGCDLLGQSCIIAPTGEIVAQASTLEDELIIARCDFERVAEIRANIFNFALHRAPEEYRIISAASCDA
ncbi:N-carbamoyl-D-amino-acid hydrolase [Motiliproteus sp. SC1-56]|uniref:N-carbamoyl-D-amino-acid hydrolase n=1 Tax=Motiliproteus sp. SC1-56 TaxID=2799565 RepID=UPI001A8C0E81|nr:N-carbamoyl-D-amino-acid hydrolase [Motiliproteus sp. SC1-56]